MRSAEWWWRRVKLGSAAKNIFFRVMLCVKYDDSEIISSAYLPRRGRTQEGEALAVYFAMNTSSVFGDICS